MPQSYVYGSPYLGAANAAAATGMMPIPATQLSHAAAIAAATTQFYEYQVSLRIYFLIILCLNGFWDIYKSFV